jgi:hypothetical protein
MLTEVSNQFFDGVRVGGGVEEEEIVDEVSEDQPTTVRVGLGEDARCGSAGGKAPLDQACAVVFVPAAASLTEARVRLEVLGDDLEAGWRDRRRAVTLR